MRQNGDRPIAYAIETPSCYRVCEVPVEGEARSVAVSVLNRHPPTGETAMREQDAGVPSPRR